MPRFRDLNKGPDVRTPDKPDKPDKDEEDKPTGPSADDIFTDVENSLSSKDVSDAYKAHAQTQKEAYDVSSRLFNSPYHLLRKTDIYVNTAVNLGRKYMECISSNASIVFIMPVTTRFMPELDSERKAGFANMIGDVVAGNDIDKGILEGIITEGVDTKFFDTKPSHSDYIKYVNLLCRAMAINLGLGDHPGPDKGGTALRRFNWANYKFQNLVAEDIDTSTFAPVETDSSLVQDMTDALFSDYQYVQFYADVNSSADESYSSSVGDSMITGALDQGSNLGRELNFIMNGMGTSGSMLNSAKDNILDLFSQFGTEGGILDRLGDAAVSVLKGTNLIMPQIWTGSEANPSQSFKLDLGGPYGSAYACYLETLVPYAHVMAFSLPRQNDANSHASPFLVRSFSKGWFSSQLGIVSSLAVSKSEWNVNGLPSRLTLDITITDLYKDLMISKTTEPNKYFSNVSLINYLGMTCGLELTKPQTLIQLETIGAMFSNVILDIPSIIYQDVREGIGNVLRGLWDTL